MRNEKSRLWIKTLCRSLFLLRVSTRLRIRIAQARIGARRAGGTHALDVFLAGEKAQQHIFVAHSSTAVLAGAGLQSESVGCGRAAISLARGRFRIFSFTLRSMNSAPSLPQMPMAYSMV